MELLANLVLGDRYQIQSLIGHQTGRRTFLAQDLQTERSVILKLLLFGVDFNWDDLKLFEREAEVIKSLDLPAIPKYLDWFDVDTELGKGFVLVQTYIEARSLQNWLDSGRTFSEEDLIAIATQLLTILDYLHSRQPAVIHRDIKPSNILLGDRSGNSPGQVYLVDFGSVKTAANGGTITIVGTYGYMPPEQFGGHTSPASDLYALGATIICLATGQHPSELPHRDMRIDFVDRVNITSHLINWLMWMTATNLDSRLQSAADSLVAINPLNRLNLPVTLGKKPFDSKIKIKNSGEILEVVIPPRGFHFHLIWAIPVTIFCNGMTISVFSPLMIVAQPWWVCLLLLLFAMPFLWVGLWLIWVILFELIGIRRLRITQFDISLSSEIFGLKCLPSLIEQRKHITNVENLSPTYQDSEEGRFCVIAQLNIWAGKKKFKLSGNYQNNYGYELTTPEREWLAHELTDWLNLPDKVELQKQKMEL